MKFCRGQIIAAGCGFLLALGLILPAVAQNAAETQAPPQAQTAAQAEKPAEAAAPVHAWDFIPEHAPVIVTFHPNKFIAHELYVNMKKYVKESVDPLSQRVVTEGKLTEDDVSKFEMAAFQPNYSTEFTEDRVKVDGEAVFVMPNIERYFRIFAKYAAEDKFEVINKDGKRGFHKAFVYENPETKEKTTTHILFEFVEKDLLIVRTATNRDVPPWKQWKKEGKNPLLKRLKPASDILAIAFDATTMPKEHSKKNEKLDEVSEYLEKLYIRFYQSSTDKYTAAMIMSCFDSKSLKALKLIIDAALLLTDDPEDDVEDAENREDKDFAMKECTTVQFLRALHYGTRGDDLVFQVKMSEKLIVDGIADLREKQTQKRKESFEKKQQEEQKNDKKE